MHQEIAAAVLLQNGAASLQSSEKILLDVPNCGTAEQERSALKVEIQTAEIQLVVPTVATRSSHTKVFACIKPFSYS